MLTPRQFHYAFTNTLDAGEAAEVYGCLPIPGRAQPLFHDNASYWDADQPGAGVKVPNTGTNIKVVSHNGTSMGVRIWKR